MNDKMKVKINENELRDIIAESVNEAFRYDGDDAPMKYNILVSDRDLDEMLSYFPGLINRAAATRDGLKYVYADGKIEDDMGGTDYFYIINPRMPDLQSLPTSFYGWYKGRKVIIGVWEYGGLQCGRAVYVDDKKALERMEGLARGEGFV